MVVRGSSSRCRGRLRHSDERRRNFALLMGALQGRIEQAYLHVVHDIDEFSSAEDRIFAAGAADAGAGFG